MTARTAMDIADTLMVQTLSCPCDTPGVSLCMSCECLLSLMCAVINWQAWQSVRGATYDP